MIQDKLKDYTTYNYRSLETLRSVLLSCGFKHKNINNRMLIMESKRIVELRGTYLRKVKLFREEKRPIFYLDETWYDAHDLIRSGWVDE